MGCEGNKKSFLGLKWNGRHDWFIAHGFVTFIEDSMKRLYVVQVCSGCRSIKKAGMAHETKATKNDEPTDLKGFKVI